MKLRKAEKADLRAVADSYERLFDYEDTCGSTTNWARGVYPTLGWAEQCFRDGSLFVTEEDGEFLGSVVLNHTQAEDYCNLPWSIPAEPSEVLVIHTLCIPPEKSGRGIGRFTVRSAIDYARETGCRVIRMDTWEGNLPAQHLYEKLGFRTVGTQQTLHQGVIPETLRYYEYLIK